VIPTLVEEAIVWEAERVRLVVLRILRHGTGTDGCQMGPPSDGSMEEINLSITG
jgi:hypothetical protein